MILPHGTPGTLATAACRRIGAAAVLAACVSCAAAPLRAADVAAALTALNDAAPDAGLPPDPLAGSKWIDPATTGPDAETILASLLPLRSDVPLDWVAPLEPLHDCGEPRILPPCVPPPPCHPALPPQPFDLVGVRGEPTCGPIYGGPCAPRTGSRDDGRLPRLHRVPDRLFDWFYRSR
jgi:hypothetical protein